MSKRRSRLLFWAVPVSLVTTGIVFAFWPRPMPVDLVSVARGPLQATVVDEGETRIRDIFEISAPIPGRLRRIDNEAGDLVVAGETVVAEIEPIDPDFLDVRSEAEAQAAVETALASVALAEAQLAEAEAERDFAATEVERNRRLRATGAVSERALDDAIRLFETRIAAVDSARAAIRMREAEREAAEIRLMRPTDPASDRDGCPCLRLVAPVSGQVLRVLHESEGVVTAGEPLLEIGDPEALEVVVDLLSSDAVKVVVDQPVVIEDWGGPRPLNGRVDRIEPFGFTKVSALGIEEQRVNVVVEMTDPPARRQSLAHGYGVDARIILWEAPDALTVPLTALFRDGEAWAVFKVVDGRAHVQPIQIGHRSDLDVEVRGGLAVGDTIIRYPNDHIEDGGRVTAR